MNTVRTSSPDLSYSYSLSKLQQERAFGSSISFRFPAYTSKSASKWTEEDFDILKVKVVPLTFEEFFGAHAVNIEPQFTYEDSKEVLTTTWRWECKDPRSRNFLTALSDAGHYNCGWSSVNKFALKILEDMNFTTSPAGEHIEIFQQPKLSFKMSHKEVITIPDLVMMNSDRLMLSCLCVKNKYNISDKHLVNQWPFPQVLCNALATYSINNMQARREAQTQVGVMLEESHTIRHDRFDMVIPAFSLIGTLPCFYLIPITAVFALAVAQGEIPPHMTTIYYCPGRSSIYNNVMESPKERLKYLKMFEAFKRIIPHTFKELCRFSPLGEALPASIDFGRYPKTIWNMIRRDFEASRTK